METISQFLRAKIALERLNKSDRQSLKLGYIAHAQYDHHESEEEHSDDDDDDKKECDESEESSLSDSDVESKSDTDEKPQEQAAEKDADNDGDDDEEMVSLNNKKKRSRRHRADVAGTQKEEEEPKRKKQKRVRFNTVKALRRLKDQLDEIERGLPFIVHREMDSLAHFVYIKEDKFGRQHDSIAVNSTSAIPLPKSAAELISRFCQPSSYGDLKTQTTKIDPSVRLAYEIVGDSLMLSDEAMALFNEIREEVVSNLYPGMEISFQLNKLNVYPPGGMFKMHVDTPRPGMVGTLVVELPYFYEGGELIIQTPASRCLPDDDESPTYKKGSWKLGGQTVERIHCVNRHSQAYEKLMQFVAFYGHCPHAVKPVRSGHRVTLSFYIMGADFSATHLNSAPSAATAKTLSTKVAYSRDLVPHPYLDVARTLVDPLVEQAVDYVVGAKEPLGILLTHSYSQSEHDRGHFKGMDALVVDRFRQRVQDSLYKQCKPLVAAQLHASDVCNLVASYLVDTELKMEVLPIIVHYYETYGEGCDWDGHQHVYRFTEDDVKSLLKLQPFVDNQYNGEMAFVGRLSSAELVSQEEQDAIEYTGNESQAGLTSNQYFTNAIVISSL